MSKRLSLPAFLWAVIALLVMLASPSLADTNRRILATVDDLPVTSFDVNARINLWKLLGRNTDAGDLKREALNAIIDDYGKIAATKRAKQDPQPKEVSERLDAVAKGLGTDMAGLKDKLKAQGITLSSLELQIKGQIAFARLVFGKYKEKVEVTPEAIDRKFEAVKAELEGRIAKVMSDPRMKSITVIEIQEVNFPVDLSDSATADSMLNSRFVEAQQFLKNYSGCKSARSAAAGIFNVKVGKAQEADATRVPPQMMAEFKKRGVGKAIGPFRTKGGLQVWGYCGTRNIKPQKPKVQYPTREQVENALVNEQITAIEAKYGTRFRDAVIVEYIDPAYAP